MQARHVALVLAAGIGAIAPAQTIRAGEIDAFIEAERERQHIPGIAIAVVRHGKPLYVKAYGKANLKRNQATTVTTTFNIGSVSKQVLATAALKLQDEGKLRLDDDLTKFFPDAPAEWKRITLRHLITHTAGLPRELPGWNALTVLTEKDWQRMAYAIKPTTEPGTAWAYSNAGYFILAMAISRASGMPWGVYIESTIFRPLGMNATRVADPKLTVPFRAEGYLWDGRTWQDDGPLSSVRPSGAFVTTIADLIRWEQALVDRKLLRPATSGLLTQPARLSNGQTWPYGLGWYLDAFAGTRVVHHGGGILGFRAEYARFDRGLTVLVLSNVASANCEDVAEGIARRVMPEFTLTRGAPRPDRNRALTGQVSELLRQVASKGEVSDAVATLPLRRALGGYPDALRAELKTCLGDADGVTFLREVDVARFGTVKQGQRIARVRYYRLGDGPRSQYMTGYFSPEDKLAFFETSAERP
ncbi:MAG: serine hydrolase domain-containing protein [Fimbriimonas sp.]